MPVPLWGPRRSRKAHRRLLAMLQPDQHYPRRYRSRSPLCLPAPRLSGGSFHRGTVYAGARKGNRNPHSYDLPYKQSARRPVYLPAPILYGSGDEDRKTPDDSAAVDLLLGLGGARVGTDSVPTPPPPAPHSPIPGPEVDAHAADLLLGLGVPAGPPPVALPPIPEFERTGDESLDRPMGEILRLSKQYLCNARKLILFVVIERVFFDSTTDIKARYVKNVFQCGNSFVKFRPGTKDFLEHLAQDFELVLYTQKAQPIVNQFLNLFDVSGNIFKGRIFNCGGHDAMTRWDVRDYFPEEVADMLMVFDTDAWGIDDVLLPCYPYTIFQSEFQAFIDFCHLDSIARHKTFKIPLGDVDKFPLQTMSHALDFIHASSFEGGGFDGAAFLETIEKCRNTIETQIDGIVQERQRLENEDPDPFLLDDVTQRVRLLTRDYLEGQRKLILLVDLDNTVINSSGNQIAGVTFSEEDVHHIAGGMYLRIRPNALKFLEELTEMYELVAVTFGTVLYAAAVIHDIDPDNRLFKKRIIAREYLQSPNMDDKSHALTFIPESARDMVVIIDDRPDVWPTMPMVPCDPYKFFGTLKHDGYIYKAKELAKLKVAESGYLIYNDADNHLMSILFQFLEDIYCAVYRPDIPFNPANCRYRLDSLWDSTFKIHLRVPRGRQDRPKKKRQPPPKRRRPVKRKTTSDTSKVKQPRPRWDLDRFVNHISYIHK